jgi:hypothetical protein
MYVTGSTNGSLVDVSVQNIERVNSVHCIHVYVTVSDGPRAQVRNLIAKHLRAVHKLTHATVHRSIHTYAIDEVAFTLRGVSVQPF